MAEIGIGLLFAAWFVTAYLLIAKLAGPRKQRSALWRGWASPAFDAAELASGKKPQLFLTTEALSRHHSQTSGHQQAPRQQQRQRPASDRDRR